MSRQLISWNPWTFATVSWIFPVLRAGVKKPLEEDDLPALRKSEDSRYMTDILDEFMSQSHENYEKPKKTLFGSLLPHVLPMILVDACLQVVTVSLSVLSSLMIGVILDYLDPSYPPESLFIRNGYALAFLLFVMQAVYALTSTASRSIGNVLQVRVKAAIINAVYKKSLRLSAKARVDFSVGRINSLVGPDITWILSFIDSANKIWSLPIQLALVLYFVASLLGISTLVGGGVFVGFAILAMLIAPLLTKSVKRYLQTMDERTTTLREFLYGVKVVKYHALEEHMEAKIHEKRAKQVESLYKFISMFVLLIASFVLQQLSIPLAFITYNALGNAMTASIIFPALSFFTSLITLSGMLPQVITSFMQSIVSYKRVSEFLLAEESRPHDAILSIMSNDSIAINLKNAAFTWEAMRSVETEKNAEKQKRSLVSDLATVNQNSDVFTMNELNLSIPKQSLVAVVGPTGSGKSSLLSAFAGVMRKTAGYASVNGSVAYCPQDPWIISGTVEENITLHNEGRIPRVKEAADLCMLGKDLNSFSHGLKTQIGEKGVNLSGGQKARISLARAIAKDPDVYILDDPLSALDAHVSKAIFEHTIASPVMSSKTVILATHLLHVLPKVDRVIVMEEGKIVQYGSYTELMAQPSGKLFSLMKDFHLDDADEQPAKSMVSEKLSGDHQKEDPQFEDRKTGSVTVETYKSFFSVLGFTFAVIQVFMFALGITFYAVQQLCLSAWTSNSWNLPNPDTTYLYLYIGISAAYFLQDLLNFVISMFWCIKGSKTFHDRAMNGLMYASMEFFDSQPIGRILNRMSNDVKSLDQEVGMALNGFVGNFAAAIAIFLIICASSWQIIPFCIVIIGGLFFISKFFMSSYRELKRLTSIMQSPLIANVSETLTGIPTLIAFKSQTEFINRNSLKLNQANLSDLLFRHSMFWLIFRINLLASIVSLAIALFGVSGVMPAALVGLALSQMSIFGPLANGLAQLYANFEASMIAVERLNHYVHKLPQEAPRILPGDAMLGKWPSAGEVQIDNLFLAYAASPDRMVINGIFVHIRGGEKIGVVGRTGSGKSTLMDSFFRLIEPIGGSIVIDGQDISQVGLKKLRTSIQMIPQNPILFDGNIRSNIDTLSKYSDEDLWFALDSVGMKDYVSSLSEKLESPVTEGGVNLSAGQRQLLCLAKVILEKSKILIMDEATSSVDAESDKRIQEAITTHFRTATVISVAHRLNTIAAFDKVLVLDNGSVKEFDAPYVLLQDATSVFTELVNATGAANAAAIAAVAEEHYNQKPTK
ncbi:Multidrug resistance-associated protein 1 [Entophlyctis luteolus]|nr:Multidrug resistance-associated protein 1 [Entophlyctis luteolus]KAJ3346659.1 Multidrug resistance-associated protein 1 [Entophlyctis luteolus]